MQAVGALLDLAERLRKDASRGLDAARRARMGQFLTPASVARFMAQMLRFDTQAVRLLDPGAGIGTLTAAAVDCILAAPNKPKSVSLVTYELEPAFQSHLQHVLNACVSRCRDAGIGATYNIYCEDFLAAASTRTQHPFTHAILNPPYSKINVGSEARRFISLAGLETSNLYAGFVWLAACQLLPAGQLVAITPRSFCNGPYFLPFRKRLLDLMSFERLHVFEERNVAFSDDDVLQENIIFSCSRRKQGSDPVAISTGSGTTCGVDCVHHVPYSHIVIPGDPHVFIHCLPNDMALEVRRTIERLPCTLDNLGLTVSTGRVVDFRAKEHLRWDPSPRSVPLLYSFHIVHGAVRYPVKPAKKPDALVSDKDTANLLVPLGHYVLVKRFTAKEERRRVVAAILEPERVATHAQDIGIENHLNYFHENGRPLPGSLARGLASFLNSTIVDEYFRQFSGHTQVNATDLRRLRYPSRVQLEALGTHRLPCSSQHHIDAAVEELTSQTGSA